MTITTNGKALGRGAQGLMVALMAFCLLAVGSPVQADPAGSEYLVYFGWDGGDGGAVHAANGHKIKFLGQPNPFEGDPNSTLIGLGNNKFFLGSGEYEILDENDAVLHEGQWVATKVNGFNSYGRCKDSACLTIVAEAFGVDATDWEAGKMTAKIALEGLGIATLTVWCRLPAIKNLPPMQAVPESFQVRIGSVVFGPSPGAGTLFRRTED